MAMNQLIRLQYFHCLEIHYTRTKCLKIPSACQKLNSLKLMKFIPETCLEKTHGTHSQAKGGKTGLQNRCSCHR